MEKVKTEFICNYNNAKQLVEFMGHTEGFEPTNQIQKFVWTPDITVIKQAMLDDALEREIRKKVKLDLEDGISHPIVQDIYNNNTERRKQKKPWILITINCKEGTWKEIWKDLFHIKSWIWLKKALITVEQRGETEQTAGRLVHFHLLLQDYDNTPKKIQKRFFDKFKKFIGNIKHIDMRTVKHEWKQDKIDYLSGNKVDEDKLQKQKMDKIFRSNNGLENIYSLDSLPTSESKPRGGARVGAGRPKKLKIPPIEISPKNTEIVF